MQTFKQISTSFLLSNALSLNIMTLCFGCNYLINGNCDFLYKKSDYIISLIISFILFVCFYNFFDTKKINNKTIHNLFIIISIACWCIYGNVLMFYTEDKFELVRGSDFYKCVHKPAWLSVFALFLTLSSQKIWGILSLEKYGSVNRRK